MVMQALPAFDAAVLEKMAPGELAQGCAAVFFFACRLMRYCGGTGAPMELKKDFISLFIEVCSVDKRLSVVQACLAVCDANGLSGTSVCYCCREHRRQELKETVGLWKRALQEGDVRKVASASHKLAGSARQVGAMRVLKLTKASGVHVRCECSVWY